MSRLISYDGETHSILEWSDILQINLSSLRYGLIKNNYDISEFLAKYQGRFTPPYYNRIMHIFSTMKSRCYNKKIPQYKNYGGRGIKICEEWLNNSYSFYEWSINNGYDHKLTIDRIDNNRNYEPMNCRWVTMEVQQNNKRNNVYYTYNGETHTANQWDRILGLRVGTIRDRIALNQPTSQIFNSEVYKPLELTYNGETLTIPQWEHKLGLNRVVIRNRLKAGFPIKDVLKVEDRRKTKRRNK